jgi:hypothetical protein
VLKPGAKAPVWVPLCEEGRLKEPLAKASEGGADPLFQTFALYD